MEMLSDNLAFDGTVVITEQQTSGRGQRGSTWISEPGKNLTFSIIYFPTFLSIDKVFHLSMMTSIGIVEALSSFGLKAKIKWPNDIYIEKKKIAGILIENGFEKGMVKHAVLGIGLNVNQANFYGLQATSMLGETGISFDLQHVLEQLIIHIEKIYLQLRSNKHEEIISKYYSHLLFYKTPAKYNYKGEIILATTESVTAAGKLVLLCENKRIEADLKEIQFVDLQR